MMAKSLNISEGGKSMSTKFTSIDRYNRFGLREKWLNQYFLNPQSYFQGENDLGIKMVPAFINWLKDSEISLILIERLQNLEYYYKINISPIHC